MTSIVKVRIRIFQLDINSKRDIYKNIQLRLLKIFAGDVVKQGVAGVSKFGHNIGKYILKGTKYVKDDRVNHTLDDRKINHLRNKPEKLVLQRSKRKISSQCWKMWNDV